MGNKISLWSVASRYCFCHVNCDRTSSFAKTAILFPVLETKGVDSKSESLGARVSDPAFLEGNCDLLVFENLNKVFVCWMGAPLVLGKTTMSPTRLGRSFGIVVGVGPRRVVNRQRNCRNASGSI